MKENKNILTPFKMCIINNFPFIEEDFDAITNYQLLCKVVEYLNKVIANENQVSQEVQTLSNAFIELKNYVDNYFDNLDVQEEINNKLDEMAQNGTLLTLITTYIDPFIQVQNSRIDALSNNVNAIDEKVNKATSGSPLVASDVSEMTDTNRIYVNTSNGYWYYYNGSAWVQGGVYQATEDSTTLTDLSNIVNNIVLTYHGNNYLNENTLETGQLQSDGSISTGGTYNNYKTSDYIPVGIYDEYTFLTYFSTNPTLLQAQPKRWLLFDENKDVIADSYGSDSSNLRITIDMTGATYFKYCYQATNNVVSMIVPGDAFSAYEPYTLYYVSTTKIIDNNQYKTIEEFKSEMVNKIFTHNKNLHNPSTDETNKFLNGYYITTLNNYNTTDYIPINYNQDVVISPYCRAYTLYDSLKRPYDTANITATTPQTITPIQNGYIRVSFINSISNELQIEYDEQTSFVNPEFITKFEENIHLSTTMINDIHDITLNNILSNKKLVTCGDSFTQYTNATFESGIYEGLYKVWPYLIGLRNNMTVVNMAVSGSTMAINNYSNTNFADTLYTQIPNDADYIIIKYGINDVNGGTPIGTIDSTDDTTFYGAWNKVMSYIISNHPTAKIGIIVTNGLVINTSQPNNSNYANAIIEIAKKYGIPTLNEWNDPNVPLLIRTGRTDVLSSIRDMRTETFRVAANNTHENYICHEYESTIIEDFLKRL